MLLAGTSAAPAPRPHGSKEVSTNLPELSGNIRGPRAVRTNQRNRHQNQGGERGKLVRADVATATP